LDRTACVDLPAFPLQLLQKRGQAGFPTVVVEEDKPQARILWACERARAKGILPGFRYGQALSLSAELRAGVVAPKEIAAAVEKVAELLRKLSPDVEPCFSEPGVFWLSGAGLRQLFPSASAWGRAIEAAIREAGFAAGVAVGFSRFATYAVARAAPRLLVFRDAETEGRAAKSVPLDRLSLAPELRDAVARLGVHTLGGYLKLPPGGVLLRFGREAFRLHELAAGARWDPLRAQHPEAPLEVRLELDDHEADATRLLFLIKGALQKLLKTLATRKLALSALMLELSFSRAFGEQREHLEPAEPTLDERVLLRLVHLRLESAPARAAVKGIALFADGVPAHASQLALFLSGPRRDLHAASEALAQLRAELGEQGVRKAVLRDGHLPESQFAWEPLLKLEAAKPRTGLPRVLIRRIHAQPLPVQARGGVGNIRNDGWLISGLEHGSVLRFHGPYRASGGWWTSPKVAPLEQLVQQVSGDGPEPQAKASKGTLFAPSQRPRALEQIAQNARPAVPIESTPRPSLRLISNTSVPPQPALHDERAPPMLHAPPMLRASALRPSPAEPAPPARDAATAAPIDPETPARDYGFADTRRGECLWLFYDRARRQWFIQGAVE
jgi:protein ImuB